MKIDRINEINNLLKERPTLSIKELCELFQVSKNTIRRDISVLASQGIIQKVYGGIVLCHQPANNTPEPFAARESKHSQAKRQIATLAASCVNDGDIIYIDSGTTTMHMIPELAKKQHITIVTTSVHAINIATDYDNLSVISTGGSLYIPSNAFVGPSALESLRKYNISKAFLASTGISLKHGATNASPSECEIKQLVMQKSLIKYLLVDHSKIDTASLMSFCTLNELDCIVTDEKPPAKYLDYLQANHVKLLLANSHTP